jgi:hypothetical protein
VAVLKTGLVKLGPANSRSVVACAPSLKNLNVHDRRGADHPLSIAAPSIAMGAGFYDGCLFVCGV